MDEKYQVKDWDDIRVGTIYVLFKNWNSLYLKASLTERYLINPPSSSQKSVRRRSPLRRNDLIILYEPEI